MDPCKILIIDDDEDNVQILADAFQCCGINQVHYVYTAMQAFSYLKSVEKDEDLPKLIITDMCLPGITGAEFLVDLKKMKPYVGIPIIVLATTESEKQIEEAKLLGADDYVVKPNSYEQYEKVAAKIKENIKL